ncbi:LPXTG cell wall anchor domain-containing protein [Streptococcus thermophilus]|nr:LPXTG cell wall anchor domain-containing protein [Streptococcus thermophilus]MBR2538440.1 LPXTG cell wall anchor domain-containing protein [Streptococcus sp.]MBO1148104.1 LPXTG cell wall anchor domain-containing protein [Streptococcus thermophilus]MBO1156245.1 LPXTG cell wall anchor domain-containing protein [Streptococcus thermophilus]MBO1157805.1 LPXTG cell wall anchor domain-containing protein [Streptococcus thermophilus]
MSTGFKVNADGTLTGKVSTVILTLVGTFFLVLAVLLVFKKRA